MLKQFLHSKWTSIEKIEGWRHYEVKNVLKRNKELELFSVCNKKIVVKVKISEILDKAKWISGWKDII
tara:strand:+ start:1124 stop:1327 length:204 start_codon:yes stop_codon:yes gene_type:complete